MRVAVVGAGVVGVACAHYLRAEGCEVVLLDRGRVGGGCSHGNCGYICPSHVLPLAGPGVILPTLRVLMQKNSPLAIRLGVGPSLWGWLLRFALRCNRRDMLAAAHGLHALLQSSRSLYAGLFDGSVLEADYLPHGLLFVFKSKKALDHYADTDALLRKEFGVGAEPFDGESLHALEPALLPDVAGAYRYPGDAQVRPDLLMASWREYLLKAGVEIRENTPFAGFDTLKADAFVIAAGAWTPLLAKMLHCTLPIQPGKGYSLTMPRPANCPRLPMIFEEHRVAVSPFSDGYRIGSTMEFAGYDETMNDSRLELLTSAARLYLRDPVAGPVQERWWGWRPMVPDGLPIIGRVPRMRNVWIAAGHGMLGLSLATGTGKLVSELVLGKTPHVDPHPYRVERF
jgi:D-amino-acid dehydrogenase